MTVKSISIPKWSDFNCLHNFRLITPIFISIPKWSDFNPYNI